VKACAPLFSTGKELFDAAIARSSWTQVQLRRKGEPVVIDKAKDAAPQADGSSGKPGLTPDCEKELRHTADLLRFLANRIQAGEEIQSVVGDMRRHEKRIVAVCPD
jgi:hypothetical protein